MQINKMFYDVEQKMKQDNIQKVIQFNKKQKVI